MLDLAGVKKPPIMDGRSWLPLVIGSDANKARAHAAWRHQILIEYNGPSIDPSGYSAAEYHDLSERALSTSVPSPPTAAAGIRWRGRALSEDNENACGNVADGYSCAGVGMCGGEHGKCACDAVNNTYKCLRTINATENSIFCEFDDDVHMVEYYDLLKDPFELRNMHEDRCAVQPVAF